MPAAQPAPGSESVVDRRARHCARGAAGSRGGAGSPGGVARRGRTAGSRGGRESRSRRAGARRPQPGSARDAQLRASGSHIAGDQPHGAGRSASDFEPARRRANYRGAGAQRFDLGIGRGEVRAQRGDFAALVPPRPRHEGGGGGGEQRERPAGDGAPGTALRQIIVGTSRSGARVAGSSAARSPVQPLGMGVERVAEVAAQRGDLLLQRLVERRADLERELRQQIRDVRAGRGVGGVATGTAGWDPARGDDRLTMADFVGGQQIGGPAPCARNADLIVAAAIADQPQLEQHLRDVGLLDLLRQHALGAERARLTQIQIAFLRGVHEDGDGRGARIVLDGLHGLEAVHARHHVIHEDDVGLVAREVFDGRFGGFGGIDRDFVAFEDARQKRARRFGIVHDQGSLGRHQFTLPTTLRIYGKCSGNARVLRAFWRQVAKLFCRSIS